MAIANRDLYWLAGLLEGEGCFGLCVNHNKGKVYRYPQIQLRMCDKDVMQRAANLLGAPINKYSQHRPTQSDYYQFSITCQRAAIWMNKLYPLLGKRRQKAIIKALKNSNKAYL